jgi:hypothetical protein
MQKKYSLIVNSPIEKTFSTFTTQEGLHRRMEGKIKTSFKTANDFQDPVGTKFHEDIAGVVKLDGEVIAYSAPREFGIGIEILGLKGTIFYELEKLAGNETRLNFTVEFFDGTTSRKLLLKGAFPLFNKIITRYLNSLKKISEE